MSRNAATRIRGVATQRLVIGNRLGLGKSLGTYAALVAGSTDTVTTDFAANRGLEAIDDQVAAGIIDEAEAARLGQGFMVDIDEKSAASLIKDDPAFAVTEFDTAGAFPNLDEARRGELAAHARGRVEAVARDNELAKARTDRTEALDKARAADAFEADYLSRLESGAATLAEISDAGLKGTVTPERATRLKTAFEQAETRRIEDDRLAGVLAEAREAGAPLDPDNADHAKALEIDFERVLKPALIEAQTPADIAAIRSHILRDGIAAEGLGPMLDAWWRSDNPELAARAARIRVHRPTDPPAVEMNLPFKPRPGMELTVQLLSSGAPPGQAVAAAKKIAAEDADVGIADKKSSALTSGTIRRGADRIVDSLDAASARTAGEAEPGGSEILPDDERFELADPDDVFNDAVDEGAVGETRTRRADDGVIRELLGEAAAMEAVDGADGAALDARAEKLGLDPERVRLFRDIARVTGETEDAVIDRIKSVTQGDPALGARLVRQVEDNVKRDPADPERAEAARGLSLHASGRTDATLGLATEGAAIGAGAAAGMARRAGRPGGKAAGAAAPREARPNTLTSRIEDSPFTQRQSKAMSEQARKDVQRLKDRLAKGISEPGIGRRPLQRGFVEHRARNGGRLIVKETGDNSFDIVGEFQGHKRGDAENSRIINRLIDAYKERNKK